MGKPRHSQGLAGGWSSHLGPGFTGSKHQGDGSSRHCMELEVGPISLQGLQDKPSLIKTCTRKVQGRTGCMSGHKPVGLVKKGKRWGLGRRGKAGQSRGPSFGIGLASAEVLFGPCVLFWASILDLLNGLERACKKGFRASKMDPQK